MHEPRNGTFASGIPLGGLGAGSIELCSSGYLHNWNIFNNRPWGAGPSTDIMDRDGLYFGMTVRMPGTKPCSMLLGKPVPFHPHLNDPYVMPWLEHPEHIEFRGRFPEARLRYVAESGFPVRVELRAFSPFIPLDSKNSGVPAAVFLFSVHNPCAKAADISLFGALKNPIMYDHPSGDPELYFNGAGIIISRNSDDTGRSSFGSMCLCTDRGAISYTYDWMSQRQVWEPLMNGEPLEKLEQRRGADFPYGALSTQVHVEPKETVEIPMILSWYFPNCYERKADEGHTPQKIGHKYAEWFKDAEEVGAYMLENFTYLRTETKEFIDTFYSSDAEEWFLNAVNAPLTTMFTSSWWDRSGRFGIWEGLGCCGLQTMDISFYGSFPIVLFFPELEKSQMRLSASNRTDDGKIPHLMPGAFSCSDTDRKNRIDLMPQFVLLVWRDMIWTGDREYIEEMFPAVKDALEYMKKTDTDGDGLPNNRETDQTFDQFPMHGTSSYVGLLYIAALSAAGDIAEFLEDKEFTAECRQAVPGLMNVYEEQLFNGEYYILSYDGETGKVNHGCMFDQIAGEWFMQMAGHTGLLPSEHVEKVLDSIFRLNRSPWGFWMNCAWPREEDRLDIPLHITDRVSVPWTGIEYAAASFFIVRGREDQGTSIMKDVWERYERAGLRYNHIECGEHYYRAMSSWAVFLALQGFRLDSRSQRLSFRCADSAREFLFNTPACWGRALIPSRSGGGFRIEVLRGSFVLKSIGLTGQGAVPRTAVFNASTVEYTYIKDGSDIIIEFSAEISLPMGSELSIDLGMLPEEA